MPSNKGKDKIHIAIPSNAPAMPIPKIAKDLRWGTQEKEKLILMEAKESLQKPASTVKEGNNFHSWEGWFEIAGKEELLKILLVTTTNPPVSCIVTELP